ncbi:MAG: 4-alpha-glucanotransferase [Nitrospiraceae bacterium]|nr:4-alpha-glucanotransferase [Nitrospiraceae bacterium]
MDEGLTEKDLALRMGVVPEYYDIWGRKHEVTAGTNRAILKAMGFDADDEESLRAALRECQRPKVIEPVIVANEGSAFEVRVNLPCTGKAAISMRVTDEYGNEEALQSGPAAPSELMNFEGRDFGGYLISLNGRKAGYYGISLSYECAAGAEKKGHESLLIVAPGACFTPEDYKRTWGVTFPLYSLRSGGNWGIGDLRDLGQMVDWVSSLGGDFAGVLPLHSIGLPSGKSPYSPLSRLYRSFIYLDLESIPEFQDIDGKNFITQAASFREGQFVDYEGVHALKLKALGEMFAVFCKEQYLKSTTRAAAFRDYMAAEGQSLLDYATYMALSEAHGGGWTDWPEQYRDPENPEVAGFREGHQEKVLFHAWLQWLMDEELGALSKRAREKGMRAGLYFDLAVGALAGGADAWGFKDVFAKGVDAGAPPDDFSLDGQKWGFPPLIPGKMRETGYRLFIKTIRKNLEHGGVLRIDHALGLFRMFWVPEGMSPADGAYVKYPAEEMLAIIALESTRSGAVIVAEDLGTVGEEVRAALLNRKMLSYRLFYYERQYPSPEFVPPGDYPELAFCAVTTHDLPTVHGYWSGKDIESKKALARYPSEEAYEKDIETRRKDRGLIISTLKKEGLIADNYQMPSLMDEELMLAIHRYLARTPAMLVSASLDDLLGLEEQQNMPGTTNQYPNWMRKTPLPVEEFTKNGLGQRLTGVFRGEGRGR